MKNLYSIACLLLFSLQIFSQTTVTGVSSTEANGSYTTGDQIPITVNFSGIVNVTGTPTLTLETGSNDAVVNYSSGSGTSTLTFNYTVASDHTSTDLDYVAANSLVAVSTPNPGAPVFKETYNAYDVVVDGNYAYLGTGPSGLAIIDISDPTNPGAPVYMDTGYAADIDILGNYAYVSDLSDGLAIIDISDPTNPGAPVYRDTSGFVGSEISIIAKPLDESPI